MNSNPLTPDQLKLLASIGELEAQLSLGTSRQRRQGLVYQVLSGEGVILSLATGANRTGIAPGDMSAIVDEGLVRLSSGDRGRLDLTSRGREHTRSIPTGRERAPRVRPMTVSSKPRLSYAVGLAGTIAGGAVVGSGVYVATGELVASSSLAIAVISLAVSIGSQVFDRADVRPTVAVDGERTRPVVVLTPVNYGRRPASVVAAGFSPERSSSPPHFEAFIAQVRDSGAVPVPQEILPISVPAGMPAERSLRAYAYALRLESLGRLPRYAWCRTATGDTGWLELPAELVSMIENAVEWVQRRSRTGEVIEVPLTEADQYDLP